MSRREQVLRHAVQIGGICLFWFLFLSWIGDLRVTILLAALPFIILFSWVAQLLRVIRAGHVLTFDLHSNSFLRDDVVLSPISSISSFTLVPVFFKNGRINVMRLYAVVTKRKRFYTKRKRVWIDESSSANDIQALANTLAQFTRIRVVAEK